MKITTFSGFPIDRDFGTIEEFVEYEDALWYSLDRYAKEKNVTAHQIFFTTKREIIEKSRGHTKFIFLPRYKYLKAIACLIKEIKKSTLLHVNELFPVKVTFSVGVIAKLFNVKIIHFIHTAPDFSHIKFHDKIILRLYFSMVDIFLIDTNYLKKRYEKKAIFKKVKVPFYVFPFGVNPSDFYIKKNGNIKELKVLYVGRIDPSKKIELIIDALSAVNEKVVFWIVGGLANEKYFEKLKIMLNERNIEFIYFGLVEREKLIDLYSTADVFVNMRPDEGFGKVFVESMACGTPVIGIRGSPGPEEIIKNGYNGFIVKDSKELSELLSRLSENKDLIKNISSNCVSFVHENYTYDKSYEVFKKVHDRLLEIER